MLISNPQLYTSQYLKHLVGLKTLPSNFMHRILNLSNQYIDNNLPTIDILKGITVSNLFFENSTRTRSTFELSAQKLGANILSLNMQTSSSSKGESLLDTVNNICAMQTDILIVRHHDSGCVANLLEYVPASVHIINAGDGKNEHPTQGLLDMCTIIRHKCKNRDINDIKNLKIAIVGDILHSRVAHSDIFALQNLGCEEIRIIAPNILLPHNIEDLKVKVYNNMQKGLTNVDVIIMLRIQTERMQSGLIASVDEYFTQYGLDDEKLKYAKTDAIVMHPGPINRGVEISSSVADGKQSVILQQVKYGIGVRMAVMQTLIQDSLLATNN